MALKIVIENPVLRGLQDRVLQIVARVYIDGRECRVYAPPKAAGNALGWIDHFVVRKLSEDGTGESPVAVEISTSIINQVKEKLEECKLKADIWTSNALSPDARFYAGQICLQGHVQSSDAKHEVQIGEHCPQCGNAIIDACPACKAPIRGQDLYLTTKYVRPSFCYKCGGAYPWMKDRLQTGRDLLYHDDKLTLDDRNELWDLLKYVMSNPTSDLVPAKKRLIEINLEKAKAATREAVLDLIAKYLAEMSKG